MAKFCNPLLGFLCILFLNQYVNSVPVDNQIVDNGYLGIWMKSMPHRVVSFAVEMQTRLSQEKPGENVLTSPMSAYAALMMMHLGAGDKTRQELNNVLRISENETVEYEKLHESFGEILRKIENRHQGMSSDDQSPETIITNGFFVQQDHHIRDSFINSLQKYYNSNATNVDFLEHASEATDWINSWVSKNTKNRIPKLYDTPLPSSTISVLASTLYFHGVWQNTFDKDFTKMEKFHTETSAVDVHMMQNKQVVLYSYSDLLLFDSIELLYHGGEYAMTFILPRPSQTLKNMTDHAILLSVQELERNAKVIGVDYKIPKMKLSWKNSLVNALGLETVFRNADLSRMTSGRVSVLNMLQATEMEVDEHGTVASAATAISGNRRLTPPVNVEKSFYVDRPFGVAIVHKPTKMIVFHASIYKPY